MKNLIFITVCLNVITSCGSFNKSKESDFIPPNKYIFGDSLFAWNKQGVKRGLESLGNTGWISEAYVGATVYDIQKEYESVIKLGNSVDEAVINGGANDLLLATPICYSLDSYPYGSLTDACKTVIISTIEGIDHIIQQMKEADTHKIVLISPYYPRGLVAGFNQAIDFAAPLFKSICYNENNTQCLFVDPRQVFLDGGSDYYWLDGSHPSPLGSRVLAELIDKALK
jgi:lysophospholipase L1-like esterase